LGWYRTGEVALDTRLLLKDRRMSDSAGSEGKGTWRALVVGAVLGVLLGAVVLEEPPILPATAQADSDW